MSRRFGLRTVVLLAPPGCRPSMETAGRESVRLMGCAVLACGAWRGAVPGYRPDHTAAMIDEPMAARQTTYPICRVRSLTAPYLALAPVPAVQEGEVGTRSLLPHHRHRSSQRASGEPGPALGHGSGPDATGLPEPEGCRGGGPPPAGSHGQPHSWLALRPTECRRGLPPGRARKLPRRRVPRGWSYRDGRRVRAAPRAPCQPPHLPLPPWGGLRLWRCLSSLRRSPGISAHGRF